VNRFPKYLLAAAIALALATSVGCQPKVEVKTGTRIVCTEGHVISEQVRTEEVPADQIADYRVKTVVRTCDKHVGIAKLYGEAQQAIAAGDMAAAKTKLEQVIASDPAYRKAKAQLDEIVAKKKPAVDEEDTSAPPADQQTPKPDGDASTPAASLLVWAPDKVTGFTAVKPVIDPLNIAREYVPADGSDVRSMVIIAEQSRTAAGAASALNTQVKGKYGSVKDTVTVNGHQAYFGTDGRAFAVLGFTDGSVMVAIEMSVDSGDPKGLKNELTRVAEQMP